MTRRSPGCSEGSEGEYCLERRVVPQLPAGTHEQDRSDDHAHERASRSRASHQRAWNKDVATRTVTRLFDRGGAKRPPLRARGRDSLGSADAGNGGARGSRCYSSMIPLFRPMIAAWVRSLASSFDRMLLTRPLIVSSVTCELIRNLLVRVSGGDEAQHDDLCWSQGLIAHMLGDLKRHLCRQTPLSGMDRSDRLQQVRMERVLEQVALGSRLDGAEDVHVALVGGQHDDSSAWGTPPEWR